MESSPDIALGSKDCVGVKSGDLNIRRQCFPNTLPEHGTEEQTMGPGKVFSQSL